MYRHARYFPSEENSTCSGMTGVVFNSNISCAVGKFQNLSEPSLLAVATVCPSGAKANDSTALRCPESAEDSFQNWVFQSLTWRSSLAVPTHLPSGLKRIRLMELMCPGCSATFFFVFI